jgi:hypothetical protein
LAYAAGVSVTVAIVAANMAAAAATILVLRIWVSPHVVALLAQLTRDRPERLATASIT